MHFPSIAVFLSLAVSSLAAPTPVSQKRANTLSFRTYDQFQISDGKAGNALAEVNAAFPVRYTSRKRLK